MAVAVPQAVQAGPVGDLFEGAVAAIAEEAVAIAEGCVRGGREGTALDGIDVEPAVAVIVEQADAPAHGLGQEPLRGPAILVDEAEPQRPGVIDELRQDHHGAGGTAEGRFIGQRLFEAG